MIDRIHYLHFIKAKNYKSRLVTNKVNVVLFLFIIFILCSAAEPATEPTKSVYRPRIEPAPRGFRPKSKRVAADDTTSKDGLTVGTSVSYRVSSKAGRRRRDVTTESKFRFMSSLNCIKSTCTISIF